MEEALAYTPHRWRALIEARDAAVESCMRQAGFRFEVSTDWAFLSTSPRGVFDLTNPSAVAAYQRRHGYGLVQRVSALRSARRDFAAESNEEYFTSLKSSAQERFKEVLYGTDAAGGCAGEGLATTGGVSLPDGGALGEAYGAALGELYASEAYGDWESRVVACVEDAGIEVVDGDLLTAARPHLVALLELTGSDYETDDEGRIRYTLSIDSLDPGDAPALAQLEARERHDAAVEASCREEHATELRQLLVAAADDVLEEHADDVDALRRALLTTGRAFGQHGEEQGTVKQ